LLPKPGPTDLVGARGPPHNRVRTRRETCRVKGTEAEHKHHGAGGKLLSTMIAAVAEMERSLMAARTRDGMAAAHARGRFSGRPPDLSPTQKVQSRKLYSAGDLKVRVIATSFNITPPRDYRTLDAP
jgi:DNA invertase Pin-like site-specific DNA recombinase